uniref:Ig-like domain-containing protein n=2 Tax=Takifugu rubripes TaxID=31033 RepID=A0A3B5K7W9_TAKRU
MSCYPLYPHPSLSAVCTALELSRQLSSLPSSFWHNWSCRFILSSRAWLLLRVSMSFLGVLFIFVAIGGPVGHAGSFISLHCSPEVNAQYGQTSVLGCKISISEELKDPRITWLSWMKEGVEDPLLYYKEGELEAEPGYSFASPSWSTNMDVSLRIANTTLQHEGEYTCGVMVNTVNGENTSSLIVTAKYRAPTITSRPKKITLNSGGTLECRASGGYPKGQIRWFDENGKEKTEDAKMLATPMDGGLFQLSSRLTLQKRSISSKYNCTVFNASGGLDGEVTCDFTCEATCEVKCGPTTEERKSLEKELQPAAYKIVTPLVVIGSCIVGLLLALLVCRRRTQQRQNCHHQTYEAAEEVDVSEEAEEAAEEDQHGV